MSDVSVIPDFDLNKSRNQSVYATCVALFFISFDIDVDSQVIGFSVSRVSDARLEFFAFVAASLLFLNLCMRIFEKYRTVGLKSVDGEFGAIKAHMEAHVTRLKGQCSEIAEAEESLTKLRSSISNLRDPSFLNEIDINLKQARSEFVRLFEQFRGRVVSELNGSDNLDLADYTQSAAKKVRTAADSAAKRLEEVEKRSESLSERIEAIGIVIVREEEYYRDSYEASLEKVERAVAQMGNPAENKWHTINQNLRILIFEAIIPALIYLLLLFVYVSEWARSVFLCVPSWSCVMQSV